MKAIDHSAAHVWNSDLKRNTKNGLLFQCICRSDETRFLRKKSPGNSSFLSHSQLSFFCETRRRKSAHNDDYQSLFPLIRHNLLGNQVLYEKKRELIKSSGGCQQNPQAWKIERFESLFPATHFFSGMEFWGKWIVVVAIELCGLGKTGHTFSCHIGGPRLNISSMRSYGFSTTVWR